MKKLILILFIGLAFSSCDKCSNIDCFTPPQVFTFQFLDSASGQDLYITGGLDTNAFVIRDEANHKVEFKKLTENNSFLFTVFSIGWNTGLHSYTFTLDSTKTMVLSLNMEEMHENCCTFYRRNSMKIEPYLWDESTSTGIIQVKVSD